MIFRKLVRLVEKIKLEIANRRAIGWLEHSAHIHPSERRLMIAITKFPEQKAYGQWLLDHGESSERVSAQIFGRLAHLNNPVVRHVRSTNWLIAMTRSLYLAGYDFEELRNQVQKISDQNGKDLDSRMPDWLVTQLVAAAQNSRHGPISPPDANQRNPHHIRSINPTKRLNK